MPDLKQSLLDHDLGHYRIIAEHWGVPLDAPDTRSALKALVMGLLDSDLISEIIEALPEKAIQALKSIQEKNGRVPWHQFTRNFGEVREMGPGRRDRERPDREPASTVEILWYRALVGRAFFDTSRGTEEFAYIPTDLLALIPVTVFSTKDPYGELQTSVLGRAATAAERAFPLLTTDRILDHACTLLAGLRVGLEVPPLDSFPTAFIQDIINQNGILGPNDVPNPEATRAFLESPRADALMLLAQTWLNSPDYNDLHQVPNLRAEGEWQNNPLETRQLIAQMIAPIPGLTWWSLSAFIADIHQRYPDYQRPAGDYDSWFLRDTGTDKYLRGFEHWNEVDGALIRYLITGPMHWLGLMDLAAPGEGEPVTAFKLSKWAGKIMLGQAPEGLADEKDQIHVRSDGRVSVPILGPRAVRYQLARFCLWEDGNVHEYRYRLTPSSLSKARASGLRISHLISLLRRHADSIPPNIITALDRWDERGTEVRIQDVTVLRLGSPQILQALRNSRAARFLGDPLGPTTIIVKPGAEEKVLAVLTEMGYFGEGEE